MQQPQLVRLESVGSVRTLTLNRPERRNAIIPEMIDRIWETLDQLEADPSARVLVLRGEGSAFCTGADISWMQQSGERGSLPSGPHDFAQLLRRLSGFPKPTIARVHGVTVGGGCGLAAVCDLVVASTSATFALSEVKLGLVPAMISPYLIQRMGPIHARDCFITGRRFDGVEAVRLGLADRCVDDAQLDTVIDELAEQLIGSGPQAIGLCKELCAAIPSMSATEVDAYTVSVIEQAKASPEGQEGMIAFLEKRKPSWAS